MVLSQISTVHVSMGMLPSVILQNKMTMRSQANRNNYSAGRKVENTWNDPMSVGNRLDWKIYFFFLRSYLSNSGTEESYAMSEC